MSEEKKEHTMDPNVEAARQHFKEARQAMHKTFEAWMPAGYLENRRKVRKEVLLGLRSLLDAAIKYSEKETSTPDK
jgi:hypothetical protein